VVELSKPYIPTRPLKGFEHINRYWDRALDIPAAKILPGECYVSDRGEMVVTVLGSCVAACIRDKVIGVGGMNHFMLPIQSSEKMISRNSAVNPELCYGNWAMEYLINAILKSGGRRENLEVKLFGGGKVLSCMTKIDIGARNIEFVLNFLKQEKLPVAAINVGDTCARKVLYFPDTGAVKLKRLRSLANQTIEKREQAYFDSMRKNTYAGDIEIF